MLTPEDNLSSLHINDNNLSTDLRNTAEATTIPRDIDFQALAIQAVEQYWAERDKGLIDREGAPTDESSYLHRIALERFASSRKEFIMELLVTGGPSLVFAILLWLLFSSGWKPLGSNHYVVPLMGVLVALWALWVGARYILRPVAKEQIKENSIHHFIGAAVGGLLAASLLLWSTVLQQRDAQQTANQEVRDTTLALAQDRMLDVSRVTIERSLATDSLEKAALEPSNIGLTNRKQLKVRVEQVNSQKIVYRGEAEGVPGSLVATLAKNSGSLTVETVDGAEGGGELKFFVGTVERVSGEAMTLRLLGELGEEITISLSLHNLVLPPNKGDTVFVATDPDTNAAIQVVGIQKSAGLNRPDSQNLSNCFAISQSEIRN